MTGERHAESHRIMGIQRDNLSGIGGLVGIEYWPMQSPERRPARLRLGAIGDPGD